MKRLFTILVAIILAANLWAQSPERISYQAVVRDVGENLIKNSNIGMQISILEGSITGSAVYIERHFPTTNANGLVSLEIGSGTMISGDFTIIDWSSGPYFIKAETDINGGANYTISGTSQILSVPYALHAKTADNGISTTQANEIAANTLKVGYTDALVSANTNVVANTAKNSYPEADEEKVGGIAMGAEVNVNADWNAGSGDAQILNKPAIPAAADGSETKVIAGTNIMITGSGTSGSPYDISTLDFEIGDYFEGGTVFWVDITGQHGLIAFIGDVDGGTGTQWRNGVNRYTGATAIGYYSGLLNTAIIIASQMQDNPTGDFAAKQCINLVVGSPSNIFSGDWYLPSEGELRLLSAASTSLSGFVNAYYWSSTEVDDGRAWAQNMVTGARLERTKDTPCRVRCIRRF